jgi:hypothetical protein
MDRCRLYFGSLQRGLFGRELRIIRIPAVAPIEILELEKSNYWIAGPSRESEAPTAPSIENRYATKLA